MGMNTATKTALAALLTLALGACFHVELNGPVSGATVVITELRTGVVAQDNLTTADDAFGVASYTQEVWDGYEDIVKFVVLGDFFTKKSNFVKSRVYLVTVTGGRDEDADADGVLDEESTPVAGTLHAIMKGNHLRPGGFVISPITEALYQSVKDDIPNLSDSELFALLTKKTRSILKEVNNKGNVNYTDALVWTELSHLNKYKLDFSSVEDLADAITAGASDSEIAQLSAIVLSEEPPVSAQQYFTDNISAPIVQGRCVTCHTAGGIAPNQGARLVLVTNSNSNHLSINNDAFITMGDVLGSADLSDHVTRKASGQVSHGGGRQLLPDSQDLLNLETYLNLLE